MSDGTKTPGEQLVFDERGQPWVHADLSLTAQAARERQRLLATLAASDYGSVELKVAYLLQHLPETRDSHTRLAVSFWHRFNAEQLDAWDGANLDVVIECENYENIERAARNIQNTLKLWPGQNEFRALREGRQAFFHQYFAEQNKGLPEIRLYLDETAANSRTYLGVAGICAVDWRQYERYHAALVAWREALGFPATLHAAEITDDNSRQLALLNEIARRKGGLMFIGHVLQSRVVTHQELASLFFQLSLDTLRHLAEAGCLQEPRVLRVIKEADETFDKMYLTQLSQDLDEAIGSEFPGRVRLAAIEPVLKGREVMLEVADQIVHALQRRACHSGSNPKDQVAEAVMNVTGLEDPRDKGIVFKRW